MNIIETINNIAAVEAILIKTDKHGNKKYRTEIVLNDGERIVIKKSGNLPVQVQVYSAPINGNAREELARHFTFAQSVNAYAKDAHLGGFRVRIPVGVLVETETVHASGRVTTSPAVCADCGDKLNSSGACPNVL